MKPPTADYSISLENVGGDYMLPPNKQNKKEKGKNQLNTKPKLSKSQKRKLKKIEEEKENEMLLAKSIETLEKYRIHDDVYSLMWSSRNLGQVETVREKRKREFEFSKAALELPKSDRPLWKRIHNDVSESVEVYENEDQSPSANDNGSENVQSSLVDFVGSPEKEVSDDAPVTAVLSSKEVANDSIGPSTSEFQQKPIDSFNNKEINSTDKVNGGLKHNLHKQNNCSSERNLVAPTVIHVSRPKVVEEQRTGLPIVMMEQEIMESINENSSVIICGETGCGKTTQVPQFLYEAGFGSKHLNTRVGTIGVTQPRRVAVLATAKRVAFELGLRLGKEVGFQVRHDRRVGENCAIKFMTDGILLREVQSDFLLKRYSVLILDEAHERSLNTDILIGMLSRVIRVRQTEYEEQQKRILAGGTIECGDRIYPLKLVLMSATLRVEDFVSNEKIFPSPPPVIEVPTRQYPVTVHFSKKTETVDYIGQAFKKVLSIHKRLPPGGILVFVTGQREVEYLCGKLRRASQEIVAKLVKGNNSNNNKNEDSSVPEEKHNLEEENDLKEISEAFEFQGNSQNEITERFGSSYMEEHHKYLEDESEDMSGDDSSEESDLEFFTDEENHSKPSESYGDEVLDFSGLKAAFESLAGKSEAKDFDQIPEVKKESNSTAKQNTEENNPGPLIVLPLYAMLPASSQLLVFEEAKEGERLVVVATNVAETSLTIPGIKYVVDTGREKTKNYNSCNGMESYEIQWISKASAAQRAGRAGRTGPGHCYRLYSSAVFSNLFPDFSSAEISKVPVDGVVLLMKSMYIPKVADFPFPTPPDTNALIEAERCLKVLEALDEKGSLTILGKAMSRYPMSPRHSRMLLTAIQILHKSKGSSRSNLVLAYAVAVAAALSLTNPFIMHIGENTVGDEKEKSFIKKMKQAVRASREKFSNPTSDLLTIAFALQRFELSRNQAEFCSENALQSKTMEEMSKLRKQLVNLVFTSTTADINKKFSWAHGTLEEVENAWSVPYEKHPLLLNEEEILGRAICAGWADRVAKRVKGGLNSNLSDGEKWVGAVKYQACMVKETVFLNRRSSVCKSAPEFLVYSELLHSKRPYIHGVTSVKPSWLVEYARSLCTFSAPLQDPKPYYDAVGDRVLLWVCPYFGQYLWELPLHGLEIKDRYTRVGVFCFGLLDGQVLPCLKGVRKHMAASPGIVLKGEACGVKRVGNLLGKMMSRKGRVVDSCEKLRVVWEENPSEFYLEIKDWFQEGFYGEFEGLWSEMRREASLDYKERFSKRVSRKKRRRI